MRIAVFGWGQYGQALGSLLTYNRVAFTPVDVDLPLSHDVDVLLQVVPTQFIRKAFNTNAQYLNSNTIIINAAKGIESDSHKFPHQIIRNLNFNQYYNLVGPSFADGVLSKDPTLVSLGYSSETHIETIKRLLQTPYFRIQPTKNYEALELASALKNVYAILCGYSDGLGLGSNTRAKLITLALQEITKLGQAMHVDVDITASGIVGDLVLTCSSPESRNYSFGKNIATMKTATVLKQSGPTLEGFNTCKSIKALAREYQIELPLAALTQSLIESGSTGQKLFFDFIAKL